MVLLRNKLLIETQLSKTDDLYNQHTLPRKYFVLDVNVATFINGMAVLKSLEQIYMYAAVGKKPAPIPSCTIECAIILSIATIISLIAVCVLNIANLAASPSNKSGIASAPDNICSYTVLKNCQQTPSVSMAGCPL